MSIADSVRRLSVLLNRSAATVVIGAALVSSLMTSLEAQEKKKPDWKDPAEYDLYKPITQTQDPKLWLESLDKWTKQYPQSELADIRRQLYLETYRQLGKTREAFNAAFDVQRDNSNNLFALSTIVGFIYQLTPPSPARPRYRRARDHQDSGEPGRDLHQRESSDGNVGCRRRQGQTGYARFCAENRGLDRLDAQGF